MFISYAEAQRMRYCPFCPSGRVVGTRKEEQNPLEILAAYGCEGGHNYWVDEKYDEDMPSAIAIAPQLPDYAYASMRNGSPLIDEGRAQR